MQMKQKRNFEQVSGDFVQTSVLQSFLDLFHLSFGFDLFVDRLAFLLFDFDLLRFDLSFWILFMCSFPGFHLRDFVSILFSLIVKNSGMILSSHTAANCS